MENYETRLCRVVKNKVLADSIPLQSVLEIISVVYNEDITPPPSLPPKIRWDIIIKNLFNEFKFVVDDDNRSTMQSLFYYFTDNEKFNKIIMKNGKSGDLNKGILLAGPIGTGKTMSMQIFEKMLQIRTTEKSYRLLKVSDVVTNYETLGAVSLNLYNHNTKLNGYHVEVENPINICFDDLGIENKEVYHYGNKTALFDKIIIDRYALWKEQNKFTFITTNFDGEDLKNFFSTRAYDRVKEMFNIILLDGKSRRK